MSRCKCVCVRVAMAATARARCGGCLLISRRVCATENARERERAGDRERAHKQRMYASEGKRACLIERERERGRATTRAFYCPSRCLLHFCCRCLCSSLAFHLPIARCWLRSWFPLARHVAAASCQFQVASSQLTHARTHSHFHFVFVAAAPPAAAPCCLLLACSSFLFGVRVSVRAAAAVAAASALGL